MEKYYTLEEGVQLIDSPNREACINLWQKNAEIFEKAKGSNTKHQVWEGGYRDHLTEAMNFAIENYSTMNGLRELPFSLSDALLILFLHDVEKPFKQLRKSEITLEDKKGFKDEKAIKEFKNELIKRAEIILTPYQQVGLDYVEGEHTAYDPHKRVMNELAAFCHVCDIISARIWYNEPKERGKW